MFDYDFLMGRSWLFNDHGLLMDGANLDGSYTDETIYSYN